MVPSFATAHMFCTSRNGPRNMDFITVTPAKTEIFFMQFITSWEKQILAKVTEIYKENKG